MICFSKYFSDISLKFPQEYFYNSELISYFDSFSVMIDVEKVFPLHELAFYESSVSRKANKNQANANQQFCEITKK